VAATAVVTMTRGGQAAAGATVQPLRPWRAQRDQQQQQEEEGGRSVWRTQRAGQGVGWMHHSSSSSCCPSEAGRALLSLRRPLSTLHP
jgi:hypothetical protein